MKNLILAILASVFIVFATTAFAESHKKHRGVPPAFNELIKLSLNEKTGLTFFLNGQALPAVVTKILDEHTIEGRSQQYDRIVIRLQRVNAIAKQ